MEKIRITVCCGTTCHVMGSGEIMDYLLQLPDEVKNKISIKGSPCLEYCYTKEAGKPPFVTINDRVISEADVMVVNRELLKELTK